MQLTGSPYDIDCIGELVAEELSVCRAEGLLQTVAVWLASYYVFNCAYPVHFKNTLVFLQKVVLNIQNSQVKAPLIISVMKKIFAGKQ